MTRDELIDYCRQRNGDLRADYLTSQADMELFVQQAEREAFFRSRLATMEETIAAGSGIDSYDVNELLFDVTRARVSTETIPLRKTSRVELNAMQPDWESRDHAKPRLWFQEGQTLFLYPIPDASYSVTIGGYCYPDILSGNYELQTPEHLQLYLAQWVLHRAYLDKNPDIENQQRSAQCLAEFERIFGTRPSARLEWQLKATTEIPAFSRNEF